MIDKLVERIKAQQTSLIHETFFGHGEGDELRRGRAQFEALQMVLNTIKELQNDAGDTPAASESPKPKGRKGKKATT